MDEVDLLKALGEVCSDATAIIESMHALRKKIRTLHADAEGDDDLAEVYKLVHAQIEAVMEALRVTQARVEGRVRASIAGSPVAGPYRPCCRAVVGTGRAGTGRGGSRGSDPVRSRIVKAGGLGQPCEQLECNIYLPERIIQRSGFRHMRKSAGA